MLLDMNHVSVARGDKTVLNDLSMRIGVGEHIAILGPNGCGKSTLIKTITRECYPLQLPGSHMKILGQERWEIAQLRSVLGIVSNDLMSACTRPIIARELILSGFFSSIGIWPHHSVTAAMREKTDRLLAEMQASHLAERRMSELSSGEARRILICRALVHSPKTLLLDEPSTSLDVLVQRELVDILRQLAARGTGILLITHHLADIIPEIDRIVLMQGGRILTDGPKHLVLTEETLSALFGTPVALARRDGFYHAW